MASEVITDPGKGRWFSEKSWQSLHLENGPDICDKYLLK